MVQDVQLHGSRRLVADAMSSSTSIRPRNSKIIEQPCKESSVEQPAERLDRLLHISGVPFVQFVF